MSDDSRIAVRDARRPGFFQVDNEIISVYGPQIGAYGVAVYGLLCMHADRNEQAWPSRSTIAKQLNISVATVIRTIEKLQSVGLIAIDRPDKHGCAKQETNLYTLLHIEKHPSCSQQPGVVSESNQPGSSQQPAWYPTATTLVAVSNANKTQLTKPREQDSERETTIAPAAPDAPPPKPPNGKAERKTTGPLASLTPDERKPVDLYCATFRRNPNGQQIAAIVKNVTDLDRWHETLTTWSLSGWSPVNVKGMLDRYANGGHGAIATGYASPSARAPDDRPGNVMSDAEKRRVLAGMGITMDVGKEST